MNSSVTLSSDDLLDLFRYSIKQKEASLSILIKNNSYLNQIIFPQGNTKHVLDQYDLFLKSYKNFNFVFKEYRDFYNVYYSLEENLASIQSATMSIETYMFALTSELLPSNLTEEDILEYFKTIKSSS